MENQKEKESKQKRKRNRGTNEEEKYKNVVKVRYNKSQYELIKEMAKKADSPLAVLIRNLSLNNNVISKFDFKTYNQIIKIGGNINQIAKKFNTIFAKEELKGEFENLKIFINELRKILNTK